MDWPRLDTRWWNLSFGVAATTAMAACGPTITLDDGGETITDTDGETESDTTPNTQPPPVECVNSSDCEPGWECIDNQCIPYDYCADGGCCYDGCCYDYDGCCYGECYYYECYGDADCGPGGLCELFQECTWVAPVEDCFDAPELLPLPLTGDGDEVVSLSFVEVEGDADEELVIAQESGTAVLVRMDAPGELAPLPFPPDAPVLDVVSGDFTGDGLPDLVGADALGRISILAGDGLGGFVLANEAPAVGPVTQLSVLDWNGDGNPDLAMLGGDGLATIYEGNGAGDFQSVLALSTDNSARDLVTGTFGADAFDDAAVHTEERGSVFWGNAVEDTMSDGDLGFNDHGPRHLSGADFDGGGVGDLVGYTVVETFDTPWTLLEGWRDAFGELPRQAVYNPIRQMEVGDVGGDGIPDAVGLDAFTLTLLHGNAEGGDGPLFLCSDRLPLEFDAQQLAVGDFDGDGRDEIALSGSTGVTLIVVQ